MGLETSPAVELRSKVVSRVVLAIIWLAFGLYAACVVLILKGEPVPGELWLGAGNASGALVALLINSKNDSGPQAVVGVPGAEPVTVTPEVDPAESEEAEQLVEQDVPSLSPRSRRPR